MNRKEALGFGGRPDLIIMRGLPGSRKTRLARKIMEVEYGNTGVILSTDDYFIDRKGKYNFKLEQLGEAHSWNRKRAEEAMCNRRHPIIIDNTNMRFDDMRPYVEMGCAHRYFVTFKKTPDTFQCSVEELHRRANCGIPIEVMYRMKRNYRRAKSVYHVLYGTDGT